MENDQNPVRVHTNPCTMEIDECQLAADQGIVNVHNEFFPLRNHFSLIYCCTDNGWWQ